MRNQKGITLIALVITIIVLLILAGVSIAMLTGDNGILTQANSAKVTTIEGDVDEQVRMGVAAIRLSIANEAAKDNSYDAREKTATLGAELLADLKTTSGKNTGWSVTANPSTDTPGTTENASFTVEYAGEDYKNAANSSSAKITYTVTVNQQTLALTDATITK